MRLDRNNNLLDDIPVTSTVLGIELFPLAMHPSLISPVSLRLFLCASVHYSLSLSLSVKYFSSSVELVMISVC